MNAALDDQELHAAIAAMQALLQSRRGPSLALVMLDGDEVIEIHDRVAWNVFVALIEAVNDCYTERSLTGMIMKAAFPSELYPHLHPNNKDRVESRNVFISWRYRDLVSFLAKRFMRLIHRDAAEVDYAKLDEFHPAQAFLYSILPAETATKRGLSFDTIAYVVRHSQKKPRQLLTIMNAVLTYARERGLGATQLSDTSDVIRTGVHRRLDILVDGALDSYSRIYPNAARLVRDTLFKAQAYFEYGELDRLVGQHAALRETGGLSRDQHKSLLIECGALGTASVVSPLQDGKYWLVEAQFEYQVKGLISLSPQQICVVHPMFYDALGTTIDSNVLVYPVPKEDDERETLLKRGIQLAVNHID